MWFLCKTEQKVQQNKITRTISEVAHFLNSWSIFSSTAESIVAELRDQRDQGMEQDDLFRCVLVQWTHI